MGRRARTSINAFISEKRWDADGVAAARNPVSGALLWSSSQIGGIHWASPIVANGMLYIADQGGNLNAFALP